MEFELKPLIYHYTYYSLTCGTRFSEGQRIRRVVVVVVSVGHDFVRPRNLYAPHGRGQGGAQRDQRRRIATNLNRKESTYNG